MVQKLFEELSSMYTETGMMKQVYYGRDAHAVTHPIASKRWRITNESMDG